MKRYDPNPCCVCNSQGLMYSDDTNGEYVLYDDVVTLAQPAALVMEWIRAGRFTDAELEAFRILIEEK